MKKNFVLPTVPTIPYNTARILGDPIIDVQETTLVENPEQNEESQPETDEFRVPRNFAEFKNLMLAEIEAQPIQIIGGGIAVAVSLGALFFLF